MKRLISGLKYAFVFPLALLLMPASGKAMAIFFLTAAALFCLLTFRAGGWREDKPGKLGILSLAVFALLLGQMYLDFYARWTDSRTMLRLTAKLGITPQLLVTIAAVILCAMAFGGGLYAVTRCPALLLRKGHDLYEKRPKLAVGLLIIAVSLGEHFLLGYTSLQSFEYAAGCGLPLLVLNLLLAGAVNLLLAALLRSWKSGLIVSGTVVAVWGIVNYYVILFHGSPMFLSELENVKTALAVAGGYTIPIALAPIIVLVLYLLELVLLKLAPKGKLSGRESRIFCLLVAANIALFALGMRIFWPDLGWNWRDAIQNNGFLVCTVKDLSYRMHPFVVPDGFDANAPIPCEAAAQDPQPVTAPDIILILNESFCDLDAYTEIRADQDYLAPLYAIENAAIGYAVTPSVGGGTNNSEFELLTSNSMYLIRNYAPFNFVNFARSDNSVVKYLKQFGYTTAAMHCGMPENYMRNKAYPQMGFDTILLGEEPFRQSHNGKRPWLDGDNYADLMTYAEAMGDGPRFLYLLTLQNHGGYEMNEPELDTVHTQLDFGHLTDDIDEYLSSVALSAQAFRELTVQYAQSDRPVIICMVGDHAPSFILDMRSTASRSEVEDEIAKRTVPYIIWANFEVDFSDCGDYVTMTDLVPILAKLAGLPLPAYYRMLLKLHEALPVRSAIGAYRDSAGFFGKINPDMPMYHDLQTYYYAEYASLARSRNYDEALFQ